MDNAIVATGLSFAVTILTSLFKANTFSAKQKNLIATGLSVVAGAATILLNGADFSAGNVTATAVAIYGASQIAYQFILKGTAIDTLVTNTNLFGSNAAQVEEVLKAAEAVEKVVSKKTTPKKTAAKKAATKPKAKNS